MERAILIDVNQAEAVVTAAIPSRGTVKQSIDAAGSCVLREPIAAERDQPPFNRVTMDGIAISFAALESHRTFDIASTQLAGDAPHILPSPQHCIEVMTGAYLPEDCDCVIPLEVYDKSNSRITLHDDYQPGQWRNTHLRASDRKRGETLLSPGTRIGPPEMAIIASAGVDSVSISEPIRTAIVSTGNELVDVGQPIEDYQIRRSNDRALAAALKQRGHEQVSCAHLMDEAQSLKQKLGALLADHDVLIISGGVSKGVKDLVPGVLQELGVEKHFHGVTQRPGKPLWFGSVDGSKLVFGLPGNPVSSLVCFARYVLPAMDKAVGLPPEVPEYAILAEPVTFEPELSWFLPVTLQERDDHIVALPRITNTSGDFVSLAGTHGFVELEKDQKEFPPGHRAKLYRW